MRMPPMVIDEVILLVDTYFKIKATTDKALQQFYREDLSVTLRSLSFFPDYKNDRTFRNVAGMTLLLMDLDNVVAKKSRGNEISKKARDVLSRYQEDQLLLNNVAQVIKYISLTGLASSFHVETTCNFIGGTLLFGYHNYLETNTDTADQVRKNVIELNTNQCSVCIDDLSFTYGSKAPSLLELHLAVPIEWYTLNLTPSTQQLILLCPNCHRFAHSDIDLFAKDQLRSAIKL